VRACADIVEQSGQRLAHRRCAEAKGTKTTVVRIVRRNANLRARRELSSLATLMIFPATCPFPRQRLRL
jgi:hypothetical protein